MNFRQTFAFTAFVVAAVVAIAAWDSQTGVQGRHYAPLSFSTEGRGVQPRSSLPVTILTNSAYEVGYSEILHDPIWVEYDLRQSEITGEPEKRPKGGFATDERTSSRITSRDYVGSGYDRGHMAPSYALGKFHGSDAQKQTFTMSNVVPQTHFCNDGVWNSIERMEADDFAKRFGSIEVVDGPLFDSHPATFPSGVAIPSAFYKAIRRPDGQVIAFVVPQHPDSSRPEDYLSSPDKIRALSGVTVFPDASAEIDASQRSRIW